MRARHVMAVLLAMGFAGAAQANDPQTHFAWFKRLCLDGKGRQAVIGKAMAGLESSGHATRIIDGPNDGWSLPALKMQVQNPAEGLCAVSSTNGTLAAAQEVLERDGYDYARTAGLEWIEDPVDSAPNAKAGMRTYQLLDGRKLQAQLRLSGADARYPTTQYRFVYIAGPKE